MKRFTWILLVGCSSDSGGAMRDAGGDAARGDGAVRDGATPDAMRDAQADGRACPPPSFHPGVRSEHAGALDPATGKLAIFGGTTAVPMNCGFPTPRFVDETWVLDTACAVWHRVDATGPSARGRHMTAYDPAGRMFVFGGRYRAGGTTYTLYNDLWAFDFASETWTMIDAGGSGAAYPGARDGGALGYDPAGNALWLYGGDRSTSGASYRPQADTWRFDLASGAWTHVTTTTAPDARLLVAYTFDPNHGRLVVFGGADARAFNPDATYFDDLWSLDVATSTWTQVDPGSGAGGGAGPEGRFFASIAVNRPSGDVWLFGGHDAGLGNRNDLWAHREGGAWERVFGGDVARAAAFGFCDFPSDYTTIDTTIPERRSAFAMASAGDALWLTGGKTDCGAIDDTWRLDVAPPSWTKAAAATEGESCLRAHATDGVPCMRLCF